MTEASKRNPWDHGLIVAGVLLAAAASLFVVVVLVALAFGAEVFEGQNPGAKYVAWAMLAIIALMSFVVVKSARWRRS